MGEILSPESLDALVVNPNLGSAVMEAALEKLRQADIDRRNSLNGSVLARISRLYDRNMLHDLQDALTENFYWGCHRAIFIAAVASQDGILKEGPYYNSVPAGLMSACRWPGGCLRTLTEKARLSAYNACPAIHAAEQIVSPKPNSIWVEAGVQVGIDSSQEYQITECYPCIRCLVHTAAKGIETLAFVSVGEIKICDIKAHLEYLVLKETLKDLL